MRVELIGVAIGVLGWVGVASAQFQPGFGNPAMPYGGGGYGSLGGGMGGGFGNNVMPNIYNQQTQPLSPYLNMFRGGGNPAANYYFGTRPGTVGGWGGMGLAPNMAFGGNRGPFPFQFTQEEAGPLVGEPAEGYTLPPAGHAVLFNNTLGYYPYPFGNNGRNGFRAGMQNMQGIGGNRPGGQPATPKR